jgi:hypothetical protein
MPKFRKKPVVVEAFQLTGGLDQKDDPLWIVEAIKRGDVSFFGSASHPIGMRIKAPVGTLFAYGGDWIIRGVKGEIYPCKPGIFAATYEPAEPSSMDSKRSSKDFEQAEEVIMTFDDRWQPIETAPKDGTCFLGICPVVPGPGDGGTTPEYDIRILWWETRGQFTSDRDCGAEQFTVWMPLPSPPKEVQANG